MDIIEIIDNRIKAHEKHLRGNIPKADTLTKDARKGLSRTQVRINELRRLKEIILSSEPSDNSRTIQSAKQEVITKIHTLMQEYDISPADLGHRC